MKMQKDEKCIWNISGGQTLSLYLRIFSPRSLASPTNLFFSLGSGLGPLEAKSLLGIPWLMFLLISSLNSPSSFLFLMTELSMGVVMMDKVEGRQDRSYRGVIILNNRLSLVCLLQDPKFPI